MPPEDKGPKQPPFWTRFPVSSPFGAEDTDIRSGPHKGIDFAVPTNTEITSARPGVVIKAGSDKQLGNYVVVQDLGGNLITHGHLASIKVKRGDDIDLDTVLGLSGATGISTGPHVHVAMSDDEGNIVDPTPLFPGVKVGTPQKAIGTKPPAKPSGSLVFGEADPNAPPAEDAEDEGNWFANLARSLSYLWKLKDSTSPTGEGPGVQSTGLFTRPPASGRTGEDLFRNAPSFLGSASANEGAQLLPVLDRSLGGTGAFAENVIRGMGMSPNIGNPFVDFMQKEVERMAMPAVFARLARGESIDQRAVADEIISTINSGKRLPMGGGDYRAAFANIPRDGTAKTPQQELLLGIMKARPDMIEELALAAMDLPPDLARVGPEILRQRHREALRRSADIPQASLAEFLFSQQ